jgi:hypothetical protein
VLVILGVTFLLFSAAGAVAGLRLRLWWRVLRGSEVVTPEELVEAARDGRLDRRLRAVVGVADVEDDRLSTVNGELCVWHRHTVVHRQVRYRTSSNGRTRRTTRSKRVADVSSGEPFALAGVTDRIDVLPEAMRVYRPQRRATRVLPGIVSKPFPDAAELMNNSIQNFYRHREWIIRAGTPLFVLGEVAGRGSRIAVRRPARGLHLISTLGRTQLIRRTGIGAAIGLGVSAVCLVAGVVVLLVAIV